MTQRRPRPLVALLGERDAEPASLAGSARLAEQTAVRRVITAADIARVVAFLASPLSVAITEDAIAAGGGVGRPIHCERVDRRLVAALPVDAVDEGPPGQVGA
jgi:hypothetical protein